MGTVKLDSHKIEAFLLLGPNLVWRICRLPNGNCTSYEDASLGHSSWISK